MNPLHSEVKFKLNRSNIESHFLLVLLLEMSRVLSITAQLKEGMPINKAVERLEEVEAEFWQSLTDFDSRLARLRP